MVLIFLKKIFRESVDVSPSSFIKLNFESSLLRLPLTFVPGHDVRTLSKCLPEEHNFIGKSIFTVDVIGNKSLGV